MEVTDYKNKQRYERLALSKYLLSYIVLHIYGPSVSAREKYVSQLEPVSVEVVSHF